MQIGVSYPGAFLGALQAAFALLVTLHSSFLLGYVAAAAGLHRLRPGTWRFAHYAGFLAGCTGALVLAYLVVGLQIAFSEEALELAAGALVGAAAWLCSRPSGLAGGGLTGLARMRMRLTDRFARVLLRVPDRIPEDWVLKRK